MVVVDGKKFACATCIKGHRSSACNHMDRPLFIIKPKGRPVTQCVHCRELRKTKQVHVKCECDTRPTASPIPDADGQPIVLRKGARKVKTYENQIPVFPDGIRDMDEAIRQLAQWEESEAAAQEPGCTCKDGGTCSCCTDRYIPKRARADSSTAGTSSRPTHASRPSISLTIPQPSDGPSSPSHSATPTHHRRGSRSHSRSPSRSNLHTATEGHVIGGSPNDHRQHPMHYSPYPTSSANGGFNQSPSSAVANAMSPALLAPPNMDNPFAYSHDMSAPASPLSVDYDRPSSAISAHSGRNSPFDFGHISGTPTHPSAGSNGMFAANDWVASDAMQAMTLTSNQSSPHSPNGVQGNAMDQLMPNAMNQQLSPVTALSSFRSTQQDVPSPISPTAPQFLSPTDSSTQTSPTSYAPMQQAFVPGPNMPDPFSASGGSLDLMGPTFGGGSQQYPDVFDGGEMDPNESGSILFGNGDRSRRGSHQSIASSHSGHAGFLQPAPEIRLMSPSPFRPAPNPISAAASPNIGVIPDGGDLTDDVFGRPNGMTNGSTCATSAKGCTCLNMDGSIKSPGERCSRVDCPCCAEMSGLDLGALFSGNTNGFAVSTERDTTNMGLTASGAFMNGNETSTASSLGLGYPQSLQIPLQTNRSRSSSQSSQLSTVSVDSFVSFASGMGGMNAGATVGGAAGLNRANSTGQIGRTRYKNIRPKPTNHNTEPVNTSSGLLQPSSGNALGSSPSQQPFSFPRAADGLGPTQTSPAVIVTQTQPPDGNAFARIMQGPFEGSSNVPQSLFGDGSSPIPNFGNGGGSTQNQTYSRQLFDYSNSGVPSTSASDPRSHSRNLSHPANLQTIVSSMGGASGPASPQPRSPIHFGDDGSGSGSASPHLHHPSSPGPNSPLLQPSSPSMHQPPPMITVSHGRSQSSSTAHLAEPRPVHYSHAGGHGRSVSTSFLDPYGRGGFPAFPSVIVTPASPHPEIMRPTSRQQ